MLLAIPAIADIEGAEDHPLLSRYPGSEIRSYFQRDFDSIFLAIGPMPVQSSADRIPEVKEVFGRATVINYRVADPAVSVLQVYQNYMVALQRLGFNALFECQSMQCGRQFTGGIHERAAISHANRNRFRTFNVYEHRQDVRYWSGQALIDQQAVHVGLTVFQRAATEPVLVILQIAEAAELVTDKIQINPEGMHRAIAQQGKVELEGILFETNKATLQASSADVVAVIGDYLKQHPDANFYVVGHTDNQGAFDYNLQLSKQRAQTVVSALIQQHGIQASRLLPFGAGPVSPVTSNLNEAGRAQNRRVELVLRD
ncbi:OmpA family protein [Alkalimonas sp. MEB108]|uniref:OmpA family protein n=1 Tax=Alkalimonas cellulosilytica TaxID=3058395 RepID=A0ABU7J264_9GAMM|nr:OmpA family protein [Alkalimonas sp. MEB108]MEE2000095.1 OmpA family protein [Alkalimonas sp. MEB108]